MSLEIEFGEKRKVARLEKAFYNGKPFIRQVYFSIEQPYKIKLNEEVIENDIIKAERTKYLSDLTSATEDKVKNIFDELNREFDNAKKEVMRRFKALEKISALVDKVLVLKDC